MARSEFSPMEWGDRVLAGHAAVTDLVTGTLYLYRNNFYDSFCSEKTLEIAIGKMLTRAATDLKIKEVLSYIKRKTAKLIDPDNYISLNNGLLNLDTLTLEKHTSKIFVKYRIDVDYRPEAGFRNWENYVITVCPEEGIRDTLQEGLGNIFQVNRYTLKKSIWLIGHKNSGKSTFLNAITSFLGSRNISTLSVNDMSKDFTNIDILDKLANIRSEVPTTIKMTGADKIKEYTGEDAIQFNPKFKQPFSARPTAKLYFACNELPPVDSGVDDAFFSRIQLVDFEQTFTKNDEFFSSITTPEMKTELLNWLIEGYRRLKESKWRLTEETEVEEVKARFAKQMLDEEVHEYAENAFDLAPDGWVPKTAVEADYAEWCRIECRVILPPHVFFKLLYRIKGIQPTKRVVEKEVVPAIAGVVLKKRLF